MLTLLTDLWGGNPSNYPVPVFATKENGDFQGPQLVITYNVDEAEPTAYGMTMEDMRVNSGGSESNQGNNYGLSTALQVDKFKRAVYKFDLENVPDGAVVTQAVLKIYAVSDFVEDGDGMTSLNLREVFATNKEWDEGIGDGNNNGDAGWRYESVEAGTTNFWLDASTNAVDTLFQATEPVGSYDLTGTSSNSWVELAINTTNINARLADGSISFMLAYPDDDSITFASKEYGGAMAYLEMKYKPEIDIDPFSIAGNAVLGGFEVRWPNTVGATYSVEYTSDLVIGTWNDLTNGVSGAGATNTFLDTDVAPQRFYRVEAQ
jgi:hypothetical protein